MRYVLFLIEYSVSFGFVIVFLPLSVLQFKDRCDIIYLGSVYIVITL